LLFLDATLDGVTNYVHLEDGRRVAQLSSGDWWTAPKTIQIVRHADVGACQPRLEKDRADNDGTAFFADHDVVHQRTYGRRGVSPSRSPNGGVGRELVPQGGDLGRHASGRELVPQGGDLGRHASRSLQKRLEVAKRSQDAAKCLPKWLEPKAKLATDSLKHMIIRFNI